VGQLRSSDDLHPPAKPLEALGSLLLGAKKPARLYGPRAVLALPDGSAVWIADPGGRCLHRFDLLRRTYNKVTRVAGVPLLSPVGLCQGPDDSIYACDSEQVAIYRLAAADGRLLQELPLSEDVRRPVALQYRQTTDELFVVDVAAHNLKVLSRDGRLQRTIGQRGDGPGEFNFPCDLAVDRDLLWIADTGNHRIQGLTFAGAARVTFGRAGDTPGALALPKSIAVDSDGHLYVVDGRFENVQIFDRTGQLLLVFGQEGTGPGEFWLPGGICIDAADRIWVCDSFNGRIQVLDYLKTCGQAPPQNTTTSPTAPE
jgi:sugar lactone lactonase YvrE